MLLYYLARFTLIRDELIFLAGSSVDEYLGAWADGFREEGLSYLIYHLKLFIDDLPAVALALILRRSKRAVVRLLATVADVAPVLYPELKDTRFVHHVVTAMLEADKISKS